MAIPEIIAAGVIIVFAGMAQSVVGFGYALFATPLLLWVGLPLPGAIALVATCSMIQSIIGACKLRAETPWRLSLIAAAVRLVSVVIGLFLLKTLAARDADQIRLVIGGILCALVVVQLLWPSDPVESMHWIWAGLAFVASGLLAGVCGMGGPPLVLWSMAHDWPARKTRGFLFAVFATSIPAQLALLSATFGASILWYAAVGVALVPLVYLASAVGLPVGNRLAKRKLRYLAYGILLVIGASTMLAAALGR